MIQFDSRYFNSAHRLGVKLSATVTGEFHDGQWFTLDDKGEAVLSTGASNKHSFITLSSRYGNFSNGIGAPITNAPAGRDTVTPSGMVNLLIGPYRLTTDQYEAGSYSVGAALKVSENAKVTPWVAGTDKPEDIVGYVAKAPVAQDQTITIIHE